MISLTPLASDYTYYLMMHSIYDFNNYTVCPKEFGKHTFLNIISSDFLSTEVNRLLLLYYQLYMIQTSLNR